MNLSYSLIDNFQACQYRTKLFSFERVPQGEGASDALRSFIGQAAHAGQAAVLLGVDVRTMIRRSLWRAERTQLPEGWDAERIIARALGMVGRWVTQVPGFNPRGLRLEGIGAYNHSPVDAKFTVPLDPPIGIFKAFVFKPDLVATDCAGHRWVYDWKWNRQLDDAEAFRFDLQSAMYQWGLARLGVQVRGHAIVQGLIEEPTPFKRTKKGRVSTRAIRNSYEAYVIACAEAGHEPDEAMRDRCMPTLRYHQNFRSEKEVEAIWRETVVPWALAISDSATRTGFLRRQSKAMCPRCPIREDCQTGQMGDHEDPRYNTIHLSPPMTASP